MPEGVEHESTLTAAQLRAAEMLVSGLRLDAIAENLGISRRQLYTWRQLPEFQRVVAEMLADVRESSLSELRSLAGAAISTIKEILHSDEAPYSVKAATAFRTLELIMGEGAIAPFPKAPASAQKRGLSDETVRMIRQSIYGIYDDEPTLSPALPESEPEVV